MKLRRITPTEISVTRNDPVDEETLDKARIIVNSIRDRGWDALIEYATQFGDINSETKCIYSRSELSAALQKIGKEERELLERTARRVTNFAQQQRDSLLDLRTTLPGGYAGHEFAPVEYAACYAPGGRYPLPSSVIMTVCTAKAAGVPNIWVASPKPTPITLASAAISGADHLLAIGGAQAIAAFAFGAHKVAKCDVIVGPGNRWVTAAKQLVAGLTSIDMLAGPSELLIWADSSADPEVIAADLLAQAEHDPDALPILVTTNDEILPAVETALAQQLAILETRSVASAAMKNGFVVVCKSRKEAQKAINQLAPEHLEVQVRDLDEAIAGLNHYGALFKGEQAAEVLGDYGAGPNHVLPTSGASRFTGGLSVLNFLRMRTWMQIEHAAAAQVLVRDAEKLAHHEGLRAHAASASRRKTSVLPSSLVSPISINDVIDASTRIRPYIKPTPVRKYPLLNEIVGNDIQVFVKHDNHLPTNAFKVRNGLSLIASLSATEKKKGVIAATRGNHGLGLAWAGSRLDVPVRICVPENNSAMKNAAIKSLNAELIEIGKDYDETVEGMLKLAKQHGYVVAHSTNNRAIIAGAGTLALEYLQQVDDLDALVFAIGGGSQAVGALTVAASIRPELDIYGVQAQKASAIHDSWHAKSPISLDSADTFADGLATRKTYELTFQALLTGLSGFVTVSEDEIAKAIQHFVRATGSIAEGAGAAGLAGLIKLGPKLAGKRVGVVLCGSNIDPETLKWALSRS